MKRELSDLLEQYVWLRNRPEFPFILDAVYQFLENKIKEAVKEENQYLISQFNQSNPND